MWLVGMVVISKFIRLKWRLAGERMLMPARVVGRAEMRSYISDVSMILQVEDFTANGNVIWGFQVRDFYIIGQICPAESKGFIVPGKMAATGAVPHREVQVVIGSFPSSRSGHSLHSVHSEKGKISILLSVLLKGFVGLVSIRLSVLKKIKEYRAVYGIGQRRRDRTCGAVKVIHYKIPRFIQICSYYLTLSDHSLR